MIFMKNQMLKRLGLGIGMMSCVCLSAAKERTSVVLPDGSQTHAAVHKKTFAVVDLAEVYNEFYPAKSAQENFRLLAKQAEDELEKMMNEGKPLFEERDTLVKKLEAPALSEEARKKLEDQLSAVAEKIRQKGQEIGRFQQEKEVKLNEHRQTVLAEHFKEINRAVDRIAKENNLDLILNRTAVLYAEPATDLTAEAVREVNKPYQKEIKEAERAEAKKSQEAKAGKK